MLDERITQQLRNWLNTPEAERDLDAGAVLLLQLNRNRWMHAHILRKRDMAKLTYELEKHLRIRLEGLTTHEVALMEREVMPKVARTLEEGAPVISTEADHPEGAHIGKRKDHDALPKYIRAIWEQNAERYFKMKQLFETLIRMEKATPCDRHELLVQLAELDTAYRKALSRYDAWRPGDPPGESAEPEADALTPRQVQAARKYLSRGRTLLHSAIEAGNSNEAAKLRQKMQQRLDALRRAGETFRPEYLADLESLGLV